MANSFIVIIHGANGHMSVYGMFNNFNEATAYRDAQHPDSNYEVMNVLPAIQGSYRYEDL